MRLRRMLISKISEARVTDKLLYYEGSITIDRAILKKAKILPGEKVEVLNLNNGARIETYVIEDEEEGKGRICINGPACRFFEIGDSIIILCYALIDEESIDTYKTIFVKLDEHNQVKDTIIR